MAFETETCDTCECPIRFLMGGHGVQPPDVRRWCTEEGGTQCRTGTVHYPRARKSEAAGN